MAEVSRRIKKRMVNLFFCFMVGVLVLTVRLFYLQVIAGPKLKQEAIEQQTRDEVIESKRGTIYDRNMNVLAQSATAETVTVNPREIDHVKNADKVIDALVSVLGEDEEAIREKVSRTDKQSVIIKKKVEKEDADKLREYGLTGIHFEEDSKRYYPYNNLASHVIGFTGTDNQGLEGLESVLDSALSGTAGRVIVAQDVRNVEMPFKYESYQAAQDGNGVVLTIDEVVQHYVEKHLENARQEYSVTEGAAAIVMNPKTGEILAMAVKPDFDLNAPMEITDEAVLSQLGNLSGEEYSDLFNSTLRKLWRNKAVVDTYEPGSTFKMIVAASAIEENLVNPYTESFLCTGGRQVANRVIHCWKTAGHGAETFVQALQNSCNPVFMEMGARIGADKFREYFEAFGLTETTSFILPGESKGIFFNESNFNVTELATSSFGQGFQITPLQMICAASAVVNGGNLMKPQLVKAYTDIDGNVIETVEPQIVRQVISEQTSATMRDLLEQVVSVGTGKGAQVSGYRIGGKTGTSEKYPRGSGKKIASFIGFAPADDPEVVCLLLLDEPHGNLTQGGQIAAPTAGKILEDILRYLGFEADNSNVTEMGVNDVLVPEMRNKSIDEAKQIATKSNLNVLVKGNGNTIKAQIPKVGSKLHKNSVVILYTEDNWEETTVEVPNVVGKNLAETREMLRNSGLNIKESEGGVTNFESDNIVAVSQNPEAGSSVVQGTVVYVNFVDIDVD